MAALTYQVTPNNDRSHDVVKSTDDAISSATAALVVDSTATKTEVMDALRAGIRAVSRDFGKVSAPADITASGTTVE